MDSEVNCVVVLVEDLQDHAAITQRVLEMDGHTVFIAGDGPAGLELIRRVKPDVCFIDIGLPRMDGFALVRTLRAEGSRAYLIALTAYGGDRNKLLAVDAGFDQYILKPMLPDERKAILSVVCGRKRSKD